MDAPVRPVGNKILACLPAEEWHILRSEFEWVPLPLKLELQDIDRPLSHVWFPRSGVISMVTDLDNGATVEVATVGREGVIGLSIVLEADEMAQRIFVQVEGEADRLPKERYHALIDSLPTLRRLMLRSAAALVTQIAQGSACNRLHPIEARCARWLLQTRDRVDSDRFHLTHEFLAQMLGVTRPSVTIAAGILQKAAIIEYGGGEVNILDRARLEEMSCECYRIVTAETERMISAA
ncbi:MAG: Crp/Fnr family transcriptional regulator [Sphingomonas sp.]|nr:Crp/Fnr family transcriptional regulator [Sphingomonas sp.]